MVARTGGKSGGMNTLDDLVAGPLRSRTYGPVYVLVGPDTFRADAVVERMRRDVLGDGPNATFNDHVFRGDEVTMEDVLQQARSYPMLGGRQVIWLRGAQTCLADDASGAAFEAYLAAPIDQTVLIVTADKVDGRRRWVKTCQQAGCLYQAEAPKGGELLAWAARTARRAGVELPDELLSLLIDLVGSDLRALSGEIDKIALLAEENGRLPAAEEILAVVMDQADLQIYAMTNHIVPDGGAEALKAWCRLAEWGETPHRAAPLIMHRFRGAVAAEALAAEGADPGAIPGLTGINSWVYRSQIRPLIARMGRQRLRDALAAALRCETALKSSPVSPAIVLERFVLEVCRRTEDR
ncbi:MAG: DNA polymerase III subunit delta [Candidatus Krumholzibacteriia bacterium]